jgi:rare lipoprotein A
MLLFGLAWVASSAGVDLPAAGLSNLADPHRPMALVGSSRPPLSIDLNPARSNPADRSPQSDRAKAIPTPKQPLAPTLPSLAGPSLSAPESILGANLFPSWLNSQGSIFDFTQPIAQWLTTLSWFGGNQPQADRPESDCVLALPQASTSGKVVDAERLRPWLEQCLLREVQSPDVLQGYVSRIQAGLAIKDWKAEDILPTLVQNEPAIQVKGRILAVVPQAVASSTSVENNEVLATEWMNQLRLALGAAPLNLVESQERMHNLESSGESMEGVASWYGPYFHGRQTATGEIFDSGQFTAAHKDLPFDTYLKITNTSTGKQLIVRINDRGPYIDGRDVDLSHGAAEYLGSEDTGVVPFTAELMRTRNDLQVRLDGPTIQLEREIPENSDPAQGTPITMLP